MKLIKSKTEDKKDEYYEVTQKHSNSDNKYGYVLYPGLSKDVFKSKASQVTVVKQDDDFHVVKDNESVWAGVNYSDSAKTFEINGTKVEVKAKGMFILKRRKMIKLMNVASIIPNLQIPIQILNIKFQ